jgi:hypothetical protein
MAAGLLAGLVPNRSVAAEKAEMSLVEFNELRQILDLKNQPWASIPWNYSITEARKLAAAAKKPIFMVVNTGNALGCT